MTGPLVTDEVTVYLVPEDVGVVRGLKAVARALGCQVRQYATLDDFLASWDAASIGCLIYGLSARRGELDVMTELARQGIHLPVILLSPTAEPSQIVQAIRAGALNFLKKPATDEELRAAVEEAIALDAANRQQRAQQGRIQRRWSRLTVPEKQVLEMLVDGRPHREMAETLGISIRAIEVRRAKIMTKMRADSLADLVRMTVVAQLGAAAPYEP